MNMPLVLLNRRRRGSVGYNPAGLFALNEPGIWLDPSDVANLDWRRNLLTYAEQFDNAAWGKINCTFSSGVVTTTTNNDGVAQAISNYTSNVSHATTWRVAAGTATWLRFVVFQTTSSTNRVSGWFNVATGAAGSATNGGTGSGSTLSFTQISAGVYDVTLLGAVNNSATAVTVQVSTATADQGTTGVSGVTYGVQRAQLELGSVATDYQRITDVNTEVLERFPRTTMYQDRAGSTAVTTPGQSVGLRLDKSKGLVLGSELVTNGDFSGGTTGWGAFSGTIAVSNGEIVLTANAGTAFPQATQTLSGLTAGRTYLMVASARRGTSVDDAYISPAGGLNVRTSSTSPTQLRVCFTASGTTQAIALGIFSGAANGTVIFDNVSVKELLGNHAVANSDAARGIYGIEPVGGRRNLLLNTDTLATQNVTVTAVEHVLSFTGTGTITLSGVSTAGPLVGTGADNRVSLTFTPTAGTLTLTVSGSVKFAQLERA